MSYPFVTQELSKITMPIVFNEPLSFLQRITEYMEHIYLINKACSHADPLERMQVSNRSRLLLGSEVFPLPKSFILRQFLTWVCVFLWDYQNNTRICLSK